MISLLLDFYMRYVVFIMILILIFPKRALMHAMKGVRVAWLVWSYSETASKVSVPDAI